MSNQKKSSKTLDYMHQNRAEDQAFVPRLKNKGIDALHYLGDRVGQ